MRRLLLTIVIGLIATPAFGAGKSAKKMAADQLNMREPEVIEKGDHSLGLRANQGSAFDGATMAGLTYEYLVTPNFGIGALLGYAKYDVTVAAGGVSMKSETKATTVALLGNFHVNIFRVRNMDTYFTGGLAHTKFKSEARSNGFGGTIGEAESDENKLIAYGNLRYFVNSNLGFTASVGTGLGNVGLGMDLLF
jgi:outer membrane protein W